VNLRAQSSLNPTVIQPLVFNCRPIRFVKLFSQLQIETFSSQTANQHAKFKNNSITR